MQLSFHLEINPTHDSDENQQFVEADSTKLLNKMKGFETKYYKEYDIWAICPIEPNSRIDSDLSVYLETHLFDLIYKKRLNIILI